MKIRITALDKLFSEYIRTRDKWTCQRCFKKYEPPTSGLQCSHFMGRRKLATRWDGENCQALCYGCHAHVTAHPHDHHTFMLRKLGEKRYNALILRSNIGRKPDLILLKVWLQEELKRLKKANNGEK